jgi:flagellar motor protein MotB
MADDKPIIVIKKKGGHGGHHGGAWKVAYADFVTAMMAFFMVMWLVNSASEPTRQNIASYFRKPGLFASGSGTPLQIGGAGFLEDAAPPRPDEKKKGSGMSATREKKKSGTDDDDLEKRVTIRSGTGKAFGLTEGFEKTKEFMVEKTDDAIPSEDRIKASGGTGNTEQPGEASGQGDATKIGGGSSDTATPDAKKAALAELVSISKSWIRKRLRCSKAAALPFSIPPPALSSNWPRWFKSFPIRSKSSVIQIRSRIRHVAMAIAIGTSPLIEPMLRVVC